jgi:hypothetical protein
VIPGKSTRVRSGVFAENILRTIGISTIPFLLPATLSVKNSIVFLTLSKSVNFLLGISLNSAQGFLASNYY